MMGSNPCVMMVHLVGALIVLAQSSNNKMAHHFNISWSLAFLAPALVD